VGVLLTGAGIFLALSLVSHSPLDHPNSSRLPAEGGNWGGRVGAYVSYGAFTAMGYAAYAWPLLLLYWGWNRLRYQSLARAAHRSAGLLGLGLLASIGAGLPTYSPHLAFRLGGALGTQVSQVLLIPYLGRPGAAVLLSALFLVTLILSTELSLRPLINGLRWLGTWSGGGFAWLGRLWARWAEYRQRKKEAVDQEPEEDDEEEEETLPAVLESFRIAEPRTEVKEERERAPEPAATEPVARQPLPERAKAARATPLPLGAERKRAGTGYRLPSVSLLDEVPGHQGASDRAALLENARVLENALGNFDVAGRVVEVSPGPVVTRYEVEPAPGVKVNRIVALADDLARVMSANGIRIQAPVPGRSVVGVEIANQQRETVYLREILETKAFRQAESKLSMALGKTISGEPFVADLTRMPHLLVAGATGSGKSVCINALICSMLFRVGPEEVRFLMVDPKVVELTMYNEIPHLLAPVITEPKKASEALKWAVAEMEARYQKLARLGVRHLADYNRKLERLNAEAGTEPEKPMSYIVIVIDEFADLMLTAPADVETSLMSLAQKSRAVGIHIILATQRPSVNVITGVIKANFPSRIAFQVASKTDSRTILDMNGAERLLGRGDMLFLPGGQGEPLRIHGAFISGEETERLVEAIKGYETEEVAVFTEEADIKSGRQGQDELFDQAVRLVVEQQQASTSFLQRRLKVGYSRAARLMDELEEAGIVGPAEGAKPRQILVGEEELEEVREGERLAQDR
jgi:S-DNA-T family DNA segregation ATPase FtsK/SpoIIIE